MSGPRAGATQLRTGKGLAVGKDSPIEWCHHTFNVVWGCTRVSPGCANCYAADWARRFGTGWGPQAERRRMSEAYWRQPLAWNRDAAKAGVRQRVFCSSMADLFEDHPTTRRELERLWPLIRATPHLEWLLLTKRDGRIQQSLPEDWDVATYPNVWLGVSVENLLETRRIASLLRVAAAVRFVSAEPLLGPIYPQDIYMVGGGAAVSVNALSGRRNNGSAMRTLFGGPTTYPKIDWVICGGESGPKARPMHPDWPRSLRDLCQKHGIPFFFKQWGEWAPRRMLGEAASGAEWGTLTADGQWFPETTPWNGHDDDGYGDGEAVMRRVGKRVAGRVLDGRTWEEVPVGVV